MNKELTPCPFCGGKPVLQHEGIEKTRSSENGDLIVRWYVKCPNCGTKKEGGITEYLFMKDETLVIKSEHYNGRQKAIEAWNRRATDE